MASFEFIEGWHHPRRHHSALGYLGHNGFERDDATGAERPVGTADNHDRTTVVDALRIDDLEVHNDPLRLPYPSLLGKAGDRRPSNSAITAPSNCVRALTCPLRAPQHEWAQAFSGDSGLIGSD